MQNSLNHNDGADDQNYQGNKSADPEGGVSGARCLALALLIAFPHVVDVIRRAEILFGRVHRI